jgi:phage tail sheath gpL-like
MAPSFLQVPSNVRVPLFTAEFDSSHAQQGPALLAYKGLILGQKLAAGSWTPDTLYKVSNVGQVIAGAGRGSMLHRQYIGWSASNKSTEVWMGVLADNGAGVAATGTIVVTGPATAAGTIPLYLGGILISVGVALNDASTAIATNIAAAINANLDLPVTASVTSSTVTLTYRHKGLSGNSYDVRSSYRDGDALPAGVGLTITALGGVIAGTTSPTMTNIIAAMADLWFQIWSHPYTDATSLTAIETELALRFGPMRQQSGLAVSSAVGTFSALSTLGAGRNSPHSIIFAQTGIAPLTPPMEFAAEIAGLMAASGAADPGRPFQTLALSNALGTPETDQWSFDERNLLLFTGISTTKRVTGGGVQIERAITTYATSPSGAPDVAYLDATTMLVLLYLRYSWVVRMQLKYPRHKLADDGTKFGAGQPVITPKIGKAEAVNWFLDMQELGLVENPDQFKRDLVCVRNATDRNRLDFLISPDLINSFIVCATQLQFIL